MSRENLYKKTHVQYPKWKDVKKYAISIIFHFFGTSISKEDFEDCLQECYLMYFMKRKKYQKTYTLTTFFKPYFLEAISKIYRERYYLTEHEFRVKLRLARFTEQFTLQFQRCPTAEEIAEHFRVKNKTAIYYLTLNERIANRIDSIDSALGDRKFDPERLCMQQERKKNFGFTSKRSFPTKK